jgi:1-acyl-sn-glycerol-3-phosphate acyltransferase
VIRTLWVAFNLLFITVTLSAIVLASALLRVRGGVYTWAARSWARWIIATSGVHVTVQGIEHLRPEQPHIVVSNHASWYDVFAIAANLPGPFSFVAKKELTRIPIFGAAWQAAGHISIDRSDTQSAIRSLQEAGERMRRERSVVVIFPEGTRSPTGELLPFKKGAFMLAIHTGVEIVPTAVSGGPRILAKGDWRVHGGEIIVRFGPPIQTMGYTESNRDELIARVRREIDAMLHPPTGEPNQTDVGNHQHLRA